MDGKLLKCIKVPRAAFAKDPIFLRAFENEALLASTLHHPNIVRLEQVSADPDVTMYLVYAFIEGMDLGELLAQTRAAGVAVDWPIVALVGLHIARALECAHTPERGGHFDRDAIIHRDLCPSNILVGRTGGTVYVIDFGFARSIARAAMLASQQFRGRIAYSAPELMEPSRPYDCRADLFSLGVVLFEALTGRRPFTAMHANEVLVHRDQVRTRAQPKIEQLRYEWAPSYGAPVPDGLVRLVRIIDRLLDYDPELRFQSAAEVGDALSAIALPASVHRDLSGLVRRFQPTERRSIRTHTGEIPSAPPPDEEWSSTDPLHVSAYLARASGFDPERDGVRVTPEAAERLIAAFAPARDVSLDDVSLDDMLGVTDPMRPAIAFDFAPEDDEPPTVPEPPTFPATLIGAAMAARSAAPATHPRPSAHAVDARAESVIPTTRPSHPRTPASDAHAAEALASDSIPAAMSSPSPSTATRMGRWGEPGQATSATSHAEPGTTPWPLAVQAELPAPAASTVAPTSARPSPPLAERHYRLPALDPSERQALRAKLWIALAFAIAIPSMAVLAAVLLGVIVPSLGPLFMWFGFVGLGTSLVPGIIAMVHVWKSRRATA